MEAKRNRYVYLIFAGDDLMPFYVGVGSDKPRKARTPRERTHIYEARGGRARANRPKNEFIRECIENDIGFRYSYEHDLTADEAHAREIELIRHYGRRDLGTGCLFNACAGGVGSRDKSPTELAKARAFRHTEEAKRRIAAAHIGMKMSEEARAKISAALTGHLGPRGAAHYRFGTGDQSPEAIKRREATRRWKARKRGEDIPLLYNGKPGRKVSKETIEKIAAHHRGMKRSYGARMKMSAAAKARDRKGNPTPHTEESKARMRAVKLGKRPSEETKAKMRATQQARRALEREHNSGRCLAPETLLRMSESQKLRRESERAARSPS